MSDMPHEEFSTEELMSFMNGLKDGTVPMQPPNMPELSLEESLTNTVADSFMASLDEANLPDELKEDLREAIGKIGGMRATAKDMSTLVKHAQELADQDPRQGDDAFCKIIQSDVISGVLMAIETSPMHTSSEKLRMTIATIITALKDYNIQI